MALAAAGLIVAGCSGDPDGPTSSQVGSESQEAQAQLDEAVALVRGGDPFEMLDLDASTFEDLGGGSGFGTGASTQGGFDGGASTTAEFDTGANTSADVATGSDTSISTGGAFGNFMFTDSIEMASLENLISELSRGGIYVVRPGTNLDLSWSITDPENMFMLTWFAGGLDAFTSGEARTYDGGTLEVTGNRTSVHIPDVAFGIFVAYVTAYTESSFVGQFAVALIMSVAFQNAVLSGI